VAVAVAVGGEEPSSVPATIVLRRCDRLPHASHRLERGVTSDRLGHAVDVVGLGASEAEEELLEPVQPVR